MLPKVLIINQPFNSHTGGGITLSNFFSGWDKDKIGVVCYHYLLKKVDTSICDTYYQLGKKEYKFIFPFSFFKRKHYSGVLRLNETDDKLLQKSKSTFRSKIIAGYFIPLAKYLKLVHKISKIELSPELCSWLKDFNPDVIYSQATNREGLKFISDVHALLKKPLVFHMMDDWPAVEAGNGLFAKKEQKKNDYAFSKFLDKPAALLSISTGMADEYRVRYGKDFIAFNNVVDIEVWNKYQKKNYELANPPTIVYAGRTGLGIEASLILIAKAVQQVNQHFKLSIKFILQTEKKPAWSAKYECVVYKDYVPYTELPRVFSEGDFLILPYDFSLHSIQFISNSIPTKAPEYMISGTPIILFAPKETEIVKYATTYQWAKVVTENNTGSLSEAIRQLILNKNHRRQIAENAVKTAKENHDSVKVRADFKAVICSLLKI